MLGIAPELLADLNARGYSDDDVARLFGQKAWQGELRVRYARPNGDLTSPMASSRHMAFVAKGWVAHSLEDDPTPLAEADVILPAEIQEYAERDRVAIWRRDRDQIESSCKHARSLLAKNWKFVGLADERRRAVAEGRPFPSKSAGAAKSK